MIKKLIVTFLLFLTPGYVLANYVDVAHLPKKPMAKHVKPIIELINNNDPSEITKFIRLNFTTDWNDGLDQSLAYIDYLHNYYGELKFHSSRSYTPELPNNELVAILFSERTETWLAATLIGEDRIQILDISPAKRPSNIPMKTLSKKQFEVNLRSYSERMYQRNVFSGSYLVAQNNDVLAQYSVGEASKRFDVKNTIDTRFDLASVSKMFTAVVIGKLVELGKIKFEDKVGQYLGNDWIEPAIASQITIEHLLTHRSGLGNEALNHPDLMKYSKTKYKSLQDFKYLVRKEKLNFKPGDSQLYSNTGVFLAGVIAESVSTKSFTHLVEQYVFKPAGMRNSGYFDSSQPIKNIAIGYERSENETGWVNNYYENFILGGPAGGAISDLGDMHKFASSLVNRKLLNDEITKKIMGFYQYPGSPFVNHSGAHFGVGSSLVIHPEKGLVVVVLSNYSNGAEVVSGKILSELNSLN